MNSITNSAQFYGLDDEDAPGHLSRFVRICETFNINNISSDVIHLKLFPFSLSGRAASWFESLPNASIATWADFQSKFLRKYFPPSKVGRLREQIHSFHMDPDESYFSAWERFQTLLNRCPRHGLSDWAIVEKFYNGLTPETQQRFNTATGGSMLDKLTIKEAEEMFESIALADQHTPSRRSVLAAKAAAIASSRGLHHVDQNARLSAQLEELTKEVRDLKLQQKCEICHKNHETADCPVDSLEEVDFLTNQNRSVNSGWRNNNSNWRAGNSSYQQRQNLFQEPAPDAAPVPHNTSKIEELLANQSQLLNQLLQNQIDQRPSGSLPSDTVPNPGPTYFKPFPNAHAKAVTTRSGRGVISSAPREEEEVDEELELETPPDKVNRRRDPASTSQSGGALVEKEKQVEQEPMRVYKPKPPYPGRLVRKNDSEQYPGFLDMLKKLHVNIPFIEALANMPKHAKFLKDLLTNKKKLEELSTVTLSEECDYLTKFCERDTSDTQIIDVENQLVEMTVFDFDQEQQLPESGGHEPIMSSQIFSDVLAVEEREFLIEKPSVENSPSLELKDLPSHLEYAFF
ncbi:uncharacterized protein LOC143564004 [Bidens hawaiensis]|uniref:uncharacterized protein LOC143564004 n=1 Tax=Bidens hawaiensis TaxID=980011 RepID=UPI00404B939D